LNNKRTNNPINKWTNKLDSSQKEKYKWPMNKCSMSLSINEMQIKTTLRVHVTPVRLAIIKKATTNADEDTGEMDHHIPLV
jgi:hypothetical protein